MSAPDSQTSADQTRVLVRYWASARAAAGVAEDAVATDTSLSVADVRRRALALHPDVPRLEQVLQVCSVLIDDEPLGRRDPETVQVSPGSTVEFLPPFAGG